VCQVGEGGWVVSVGVGVDRGGREPFAGAELQLRRVRVAADTLTAFTAWATSEGVSPSALAARLLDEWHRKVDPEARCAGGRQRWVTVRLRVPACPVCGVQAREVGVPRGLFPTSLEDAGGLGWSGVVPEHVPR
jgi:hypothetical protein